MLLRLFLRGLAAAAAISAAVLPTYASAAEPDKESADEKIKTPPPIQTIQSYPGRSIFNAFRDGCGSLSGINTARANLLDHDWEEVADNIPEGLLEAIQLGLETDEKIAQRLNGTVTGPLFFRKEILGEDLVIILKETFWENRRSTHCELYDWDEYRNISIRDLSDYLNQEAAEAAITRGAAGELYSYALWEPGMMPGHDSFDYGTQDRRDFANEDFADTYLSMSAVNTQYVADEGPAQALQNDSLSPYPAVAILNAFRTGCGGIENQAAAAASLTAAGWQVVTNDNLGALTDFLDFARDAGREIVAEQGGTMSEMQVFENTISGETVQIVLSEVDIDGVRVSGCRLFDVGETRPITIEQTAAWLGRETLTEVDNDGLIVAAWEPGISEGHDSFQIFFIPDGHPLQDLLKFHGVSLKADNLRFDQ